jgi:hypothetical protein
VGQPGQELSLDNTDLSTLGQDEEVSERAIEAVLSSIQFRPGVMIASPSAYGRLYGEEAFHLDRASPIGRNVDR